MSIKIMSAIFETEFPGDFAYEKDGEKHTAKASTAKLVLLAIADHCNDDGIAYPGLTRLETKTALSRQGVLDTIEALKFNGIIKIIGINDTHKTNTYQLNLRAFAPTLKELPQQIYNDLVKPLDQGSQATLLGVVKPLDLNHHLTIINPIAEESVNARTLTDTNSYSLNEEEQSKQPSYAKPKPERKSKKKMMDEADLQIRDMYKHSKAARENTQTLLPEQFMQQASWFIQYTGLQYVPKFQNLWISGFEEWNALGATEEDVMKAVTKLQSANLSIISPGSLTKTLNGIIANRKKAKEGYNPWK